MNWISIPLAAASASAFLRISSRNGSASLAKSKM
jgi:hypothetical protein